MSENKGNFVWYDLMTSDPAAAESFYGKVVGWTAADSGMPGPPYTILSVGAIQVGGLMPIPKDAAGASPTWMGYIGVDDVDAYAARVTAAGGAIHRAPADIPNVGRFAVAADPTGAGFILFKGNGPAPPPFSQNAPGRIGWHELHAGNGETAFSFYSGLFGWTKGEAMDMGPMGVYQMFEVDGITIGGMMTKTPQTVAPFWLYYFNVDAADAVAERIKQAGGKVTQEPHEVPGGLWIVQGIDPQGALFAVVAPKR
jgi:predicted enzyme related to lactoylglutathione lyase